MARRPGFCPEVERGIEADQCYVFDPAKIAAVTDALARDVNDVAEYPNPDLAVEVDLSTPQADRPGIYAALQVPELLAVPRRGPVNCEISAPPATKKPEPAAGCPSPRPRSLRWLVEEDTRDPAAWEVAGQGLGTS